MYDTVLPVPDHASANNSRVTDPSFPRDNNALSYSIVFNGASSSGKLEQHEKDCKRYKKADRLGWI